MSGEDRKKRRQTRVPAGRLERLARMGWMAGGFAMGGLADGAKRLAKPNKIDPTSVFLSAARAQRLAKQLSQMRGAAMKLGQMLSLEGDDLLPAGVLRRPGDAARRRRHHARQPGPAGARTGLR